jgi:hypothetical protein
VTLLPKDPKSAPLAALAAFAFSACLNVQVPKILNFWNLILECYHQKDNAVPALHVIGALAASGADIPTLGGVFSEGLIPAAVAKYQRGWRGS